MAEFKDGEYMSESNMAEFKMAAIIKLSLNQIELDWVMQNE